MQFKITLKFKQALLFVCLLCLVVFSLGKASAQGTLTTSYTPLSGLAGAPAGITFDIQNTNTTARVLTSISVNWDPTLSTSAPTAKLWVTSTSLSGVSAVATPVWTALTGFVPVTFTTAGIIPTFTGLSFTLAANTQYRFAIESTNGISYGGAGTTPNTFTADGISLQTGDFTVGGQVVGYALNPPPTMVNNPRFFSGSITWALSTACAGTPAGGNTNSSVTSSCTGIPFTISPSATAPAGTSGLTYQLQSSPTIGGTYTNVGVPTAGSSFSITQTAATAYRIIVTCANGGATATYAPIFVQVSAACYCAAGSTNTSNLFEKISNVTLNDLNRSTPATNFTGYINYLADTARLVQGATYPISITGNVNTYSGDIVAVWIDFNQDGDFIDAGENVYTSGPSAGPYTGNVVVPSSATLGITRMRVRMYDGTFGNGVNGPCGDNTYGQVQDFSVRINPCIPVTITTQPTAQTTACGGTVSYTVGVNATGSAPAYQWQVRTTPTGVFQNVVNGTFNGTTFSGANSNTLTVTNPSIAMSGSEYRVSVSGACTGSTPSNTAALTVTPLIPIVTPTVSSICAGAGTIVPISIGNPSPALITQTFNSAAALNITIPENVAGINNTIAVSGIPAGAVISNISVKLNITHGYVADVMLVVKAPNNQILNLSNLIGAANNPGVDFINTVFSSGSTTPLISGTSPGYTGTFKPDAAGAVAAFGLPGGPTGYLPTLPGGNLLSLGTVPNGNWTIAMYDAGPPDVGQLKNWSVSITYSSAATGIYTQSGTGPNTIFTNAAATTAYDGITPVTTVYVKPNTTTTYNVAINTGTCTANTSVVVNVNTPAAGTPTLSNTSVCAGFSTFLKLGGTLTGGPGFVHTFQVKAPGATNFTNITAGGVYSFLGDSLRLTGVPQSFNGYQFRDSISTGANCGSVLSTVATLTVNPLPVVSISAAPIRNLFPGLTTTLTAAVSSATPPITYQWFRNGAAVAGATNNTLVVGIDQLGTYTVRATAQGCTSADSTTTPKTIVIGDSVGVTTLFAYPSPNTGKFQVRYFNDVNTFAPSGVNVYDSRGARVFTRSYTAGPRGYTQFNVDLSAHGKGIYRIELVNANGDRLKTGSVMVF